MAHEVCPGQCLRHSGTQYPAGSLVPNLPNLEELEALGVIRQVERAPKVRPQPIAKAAAKPKKPAAKKPAAKKADG